MERFLLDVMVGKLATYLRMCGYDTAYAQEEGLEADDAIRERAESTDRTLVTRDQDLAASTDGAILIETREIEAQLTELQSYGVHIELPTVPKRCSICNGRITDVSEAEHPEHSPDAVDNVWRCRVCEQYFWKGSHWEQVQEVVRSVSGQ